MADFTNAWAAWRSAKDALEHSSDDRGDRLADAQMDAFDKLLLVPATCPQEVAQKLDAARYQYEGFELPYGVFDGLAADLRAMGQNAEVLS